MAKRKPKREVTQVDPQREPRTTLLFTNLGEWMEAHGIDEMNVAFTGQSVSYHPTKVAKWMQEKWKAMQKAAKEAGAIK